MTWITDQNVKKSKDLESLLLTLKKTDHMVLNDLTYLQVLYLSFHHVPFLTQSVLNYVSLER